MKKNWQDIFGWFNEEDAYAYNNIISRIKENALIVEIGSFLGRSTMSISELCNKRKNKIICVDYFHMDLKEACYLMPSNKIIEYEFPNFINCFNKNINGLEHMIYPLKSSSEDASKLFDFLNIKFDCIFIDANHSYDEVNKDIKNWRKLLNKNGIICGHDYSYIWPDVIKAVDENFDKININIYSEFSSVWYVQNI